jgi:stage IV sporulation protein FB
MPEIKVSPLAFIFVGILLVDGTIYALITFAAAAVHELGHLAAAALTRAPISRISLWPLGAVITLGEPCPYRTDIAVKLAGGAANLAAAGACAMMRSALNLSGPADVAAVYFIICCIALAVFNLLPIRTLDGGEALFSLLCIKFGPDTAGRVMRVVSLCALLPLWLVSGWAMFYTGGNFSLMLLCGWLFFAAVLESM